MTDRCLKAFYGSREPVGAEFGVHVGEVERARDGIYSVAATVVAAYTLDGGQPFLRLPLADRAILEFSRAPFVV